MFKGFSGNLGYIYTTGFSENFILCILVMLDFNLSPMTLSFGQEDEDRHVVIWRKEDPPSDDEINCLKTGRAWDPDLIEREKQEKLKQDILDEKEEKERIKNDKVS